MIKCKGSLDSANNCGASYKNNKHPTVTERRADDGVLPTTPLFLIEGSFNSQSNNVLFIEEFW